MKILFFICSITLVLMFNLVYISFRSEIFHQPYFMYYPGHKIYHDKEPNVQNFLKLKNRDVCNTFEFAPVEWTLYRRTPYSNNTGNETGSRLHNSIFKCLFYVAIFYTIPQHFLGGKSHSGYYHRGVHMRGRSSRGCKCLESKSSEDNCLESQ